MAIAKRARGQRTDDAEYSYPTPEQAALIAKAREVTGRVTKRHGQHPCVPGTPRCRERFLTDLCDYYQAAVCPRAADR